MSKTLSEFAWPALACSQCGAPVRRSAKGAICSACGTEFQTNAAGILDLRLKQSKTFSVDFTLGAPLAPAGFEFKPLAANPNPEVRFPSDGMPLQLTPELLSYFPRAKSAESLGLDLGCGSGLHRFAVEKAGFQWVGMDYANPNAQLLGDGHALPFQTGSIDFVVSIAVLEHLQHPFVVAREVCRVLKPGGLYIGTVSFLEPFHGDSYYHHTHLGTFNTLNTGGFNVEHVAPAAHWSGLHAQATMGGLFPRAPGALGRALVWPLEALHRLWWAAGRVLSSTGSDNTTRLLKTTGAFQFVARKPLEPNSSMNS